MSPSEKKLVNRPISKDGLMLYSKGQLFRMRRIHALLSQNKPSVGADAKKKERKPRGELLFKTKKIGGADNGGERKIRVPRLKTNYPTVTEARNRKRAARLRRRHASSSLKKGVAKLKKSLKPGVVCIVLAGCQVGKRVVFLKQMEHSGLALVTGPYKLNGCPLRRVNQIHLLPTATRINIDAITLPEAVNDDTFKRHDKRKKQLERRKRRAFGKSARQNALAQSLFEDENNDQDDAADKKSGDGRRFRLPESIRKERMELQKDVDSQVLKAISAQYGSVMKRYLQSKFHIDNGVYPHRIKF